VRAANPWCRSADTVVARAHVVAAQVEGCDGGTSRDGRDLHWRSAAGPCFHVGARRSGESSHRRDGRSGRAPFVSMMEATALRNRHDGAIAWRRDRAKDWRVLVQRCRHDHPAAISPTSPMNRVNSRCLFRRSIRHQGASCPRAGRCRSPKGAGGWPTSGGTVES
jgi:hypothetical protein